MLIHYFITTSTPDRRSSKFWHSQIQVSLSKCFEKTPCPFSRWKVISCEYDVIMLNYKKIAVFLKTIRTIEVYDRKNGDVRRIAAHWSAIQFCFPSRLTPIDTFCQLNQQKSYKNVSRAHVHTWNGRFIDGSTDNIFLGPPKYKNCRHVKSAHDGIDCDWRRIVLLEVAEMSGISKYTAQHTFTSDLSMWNLNARCIWLTFWNFY